MTVSIHCWQFYCTSCYLQSLSHHGGAVSHARVLQNSRFQPWQSMQNHRLNSQVRSPAVAGFSTSSGRCQECQDQSLCNTVALTTLSCCCCRSPAAGGHWHRRCAGLSGHAAHWLGYQVRSFFSPVCTLGWHGQPLCTFTSPCFCIYPGESWKH